MKKRFLLLLWSLIATSALAQPTAPEPGIAALRQRLAAAPTDTARVRALHALAQASMAADFDSAWQYASRAQVLATRVGDQRGLLASYADLGVLNGMRGNDEASLRLFLAQLRLADKVSGGEQQKPAIYSNMAHSYFVLGRYDQALAMMRQAQRLDEQAGNPTGVLFDLGNIAEIQLKQGRPAAALATVREGLRRRLLPPGSGTPDFGLDIHLANALLELGRYAAARDTLLALRPQLQAAGKADYLTHVEHGLLDAYRHLGQLPAAERAGQAALAYARQSGQRGTERDVLAVLAQVAAQRGDFAAAYRQHVRAAALTDSLTTEGKVKSLQDLQFRYETEKREARIRVLDREAAARRWLLALWAGLAVAAGLAAGFIYQSKRLQTKVFVQREALLEERRRQSEARQLFQEAAGAALQLEFDTNQRELTSTTLFAQQKTKLLEDLTAGLEALGTRVPDPEREAVAELKKAIRQHLQVGDDWERVTLHFEKVHPLFFEQLRQQNPGLTPNELKQCAYVKLNLTNKDIANLVNIEPNSVKIAQYRIKKKLGLPEESSLRDYILSI